MILLELILEKINILKESNNLNDKYIKKLIRILENSNIDSIQISSLWGMNRIKLVKSPSSRFLDNQINPNDSNYHKVSSLASEDSSKSKNSSLSQTPNQIILESKEENNIVETDNNQRSLEYYQIKAPLVGTFYTSSKPSDPAFIKVGDKIEPGQILCIIEAMKIFNEIESEHTGKIIKILIDDATPVEFDQDLIIISPE